MAEQVYDKEDEKSLTGSELKKREGSPETSAEALDRIPTMSEEEGLELDKKRGLSPEGDGKDQTDKIERKQPNEDSLYNPTSKSSKSLLENVRRKRRYILAGGAVTTAIIGVVVGLFGFLNVFKLDDLMSNIQQRAFLRNNAALNGRSSKYITAYLEARMLDVGDPAHPDLSNPNLSKRGNILFRSAKVDNNNPFLDWYRTMRASGFEQSLFDTKGIKFTSMVNANGKIRPGIIDVNGVKSDIPIGNLKDSDITAIQNGNIATLNKYQAYFETTEFGSNKIGRSQIKQIVTDNTHFYQVFERRQIRKAIQNMTGVSDWKFFETTRDKVQDKKNDLRNRLLDKILPDPNKNIVTDLVRCFYGLNKCSPNRDTAAPQNREGSNGGDEGTNTDTDNTNNQTPQEADLESASLADAGISDALKKILVAANIYTKIINIPSALDMLSYVNSNISKLVKLVVVARGAQAAGLFQVLSTSSDQIKSGQVNGAEVNALMQNLDTAADSAAWTQVVEGQGTPGTTQTGGACSQKAQALEEKDPDQYHKQYGDYAPLCADQQISSAANAQNIQNTYKGTIGPVVGPIVGVWSKLKGNVVTGTIIKAVSWLGNLSSKIVDPLVIGVLKTLGLYGDLKSGIAWVFAKTSNFLGASILKGYESPGTILNWALQGGAYTAESATRQEGGALSTPAAKVTALQEVAQYQSVTEQQTPILNRIASLSNPNSLASKAALSLSDLSSNPGHTIIGSISNIPSSLGNSLASIFSRNTSAATINGYSASQFAGIETYDYPTKCYNLDPINEQPIAGTNALTIFNANSITVPQADQNALNTWAVETDSDSFYNTIYDVLKNTSNADDIAVQIYNCNLLDAAVRGNLGFVYGYTDNNGLNQ